MAADQSFTTQDVALGAMKLNIERCTLGRLNRRGLYLAFHNPGACVALVSVRVFYQRCPETVHGLAQFPYTLPGPSGLVEVAGTCVPHAQVGPGPSGPPRMHCSPEGEWLVPVGRCYCEPGFEEGGGDDGKGCRGKENVEGVLRCQTPCSRLRWPGGLDGRVWRACLLYHRVLLLSLACPSGFYRAADMDMSHCLECPQHSTAESEGATVCPCESGHYRAPGEGPQAACTREFLDFSETQHALSPAELCLCSPQTLNFLLLVLWARGG